MKLHQSDKPWLIAAYIVLLTLAFVAGTKWQESQKVKTVIIQTRN